MASILLQTFSSIHFTKPFVAVSSAPTKMGITVTLMFQFFFFRTLPFTLLNQIWTFDLRVIIRWNFKVSEKLYYFLFSQSTWRWVLTFGWLRKSKPFVQFQIFSADRLSFSFSSCLLLLSQMCKIISILLEYYYFSFIFFY